MWVGGGGRGGEGGGVGGGGVCLAAKGGYAALFRLSAPDDDARDGGFRTSFLLYINQGFILGCKTLKNGITWLSTHRVTVSHDVSFGAF